MTCSGRSSSAIRVIRHVCFTGSVGGGKRIMAMAAPNLTNVTLELGGNDPAIILDDAVLDEAAIGRLASATFMTTGQVCMAVKRLYVPRSRFDEVVGGLTAALEGTRIGSGLDAETTMGPLNTARQRDYVIELREEARSAGAEVIEGGEYVGVEEGEGNFMRPSLVLDPDQGLRIVSEEQFGPALPVIPYDDEEQAIAQANDTWSGLCSSVWSGDARTRDGGRAQTAHGRHLLQQPQRDGGGRARPVRRLQPERGRPRARP